VSFDACARPPLSASFQTELTINTHVVVSNVSRDVKRTHAVVSNVHQGVFDTHAIVTDLHRNLVGTREGTGGDNQLVSVTHPFPSPNQR